MVARFNIFREDPEKREGGGVDSDKSAFSVLVACVSAVDACAHARSTCQRGFNAGKSAQARAQANLDRRLSSAISYFVEKPSSSPSVS